MYFFLYRKMNVIYTKKKGEFQLVKERDMFNQPLTSSDSETDE